MKKLLLPAISFFILAACNSGADQSAASTNETGAGATPAESKQERNKKVVMASMESFMKGDLDGTFKDAAAAFIDYGDGSTPPMTNVDSIKGFIKMLLASVENYKGENLKYYADGDYVLVHGDWGGVFKKDLMGIKATGKPVKFKDVDIFKFNDEGKITEHYAVQNLPATLMAAGAMK
ncbi:MAG: ester cyclase [Chitinophagaceae bacterium]|nr:ester cyclase [Chitinophagaceae bacterium]